MIGAILFYFQEVSLSILDMVVKFDHHVLIRIRITTSVNDNLCRVFAAPGLTSSSNSENYIVLLFSERLKDDYAKDGGPDIYVVFTKILCGRNFYVW